MIRFPTSYRCRYASKYTYTDSSIYDAADIAVSVLLNFQWAYDSMATYYNRNSVISAFY
jgi:hypothetical protein